MTSDKGSAIRDAKCRCNINTPQLRKPQVTRFLREIMNSILGLKVND